MSQLIVLLKPYLNCSSTFTLSWVDEVITGTWSFVPAIVNVAALVSLDNTHLSDQVKMRLISNLMKGISRLYQKLIKYFNRTNILRFFLQFSPVTPVMFCSNLNEALWSAGWKLPIVPASVKTGSSL